MTENNSNKTAKISGVSGLLGFIRLKLFIRRLKKEKIHQLWEAHMDKYYYQNQMKDWLNFDENPQRDILAKERKKDPKDRDFGKVEEAEEKIARSKAIKMSFRKNEEFIGDAEKYINAISKWQSQN